jgi:hypothetical protein
MRSSEGYPATDDGLAITTILLPEGDRQAFRLAAFGQIYSDSHHLVKGATQAIARGHATASERDAMLGRLDRMRAAVEWLGQVGWSERQYVARNGGRSR